MRMKKILLLLILSSLLSISSDPIRDDPAGQYYYNFSLIPYTGGIGVNLGSEYYPRHNPSGDITWKRWDGKDANGVVGDEGIDFNGDGKKDNEERNFDLGAANGQYSNYYTDYHIIAIGGAYNIPYGDVVVDSSSDDYDARNSELLKKLDFSDNTENTINISRNSITLTVTAECSSNFEFVSQSNPIYRRPFEIEIIPRVSLNGFSNPSTEYIYPLGNSSNTMTVDIPANVSDDYNNRLEMIAADMVIVLPYDYSKYGSGGGYFSGGLTYNNATYALADLNDYTAVVTMTVTLSFDYSYRVNGQWVNKTYSDTRVMTIPFSGYYSSSGSGDKLEESISLFVSPTNSAANLDLRVQGRWITVGNLTFMYIDNSVPAVDNSNADIVSIFLSSSPYPNVQGSSEFRMIHENATNVITNTNSLGFTARITGTGADYNDISLGSSVSNTVEFDGLAYTENIMHYNANGDIAGDKDVVKTLCNYGYVSNVPAERHFHTFEGEVQIMFDESDMLQAGIYRGYVYVHAVTEEEYPE